MTFRGAGVGFVVILLIVPLGLQAPTRAFADVPCYEAEEVIFRTGNGGQYGTTNQFRSFDRTLNPNCTAWAAAWSTAHDMLGNIYGNWTEFGYQMWCTGTCVGLSGHNFYFFSEWGLGGNFHEFAWWAQYCIGDHATYKKFRVANVLGTTKWQHSLDCQDGNGWHQNFTSLSTGYSVGVSAGETGRRGGIATTAQDDQTTLRYKNSSGSWKTWSYNFFFCDSISDWDGSSVSADHYHVISGTSSFGTCPP